MAGVRPQKLDAFARVLPILEWLPTYQPRWLHADAIAGLTLLGILVPEMIAKAAMADAPLQSGLYTLLGSLVVSQWPEGTWGTTRSPGPGRGNYLPPMRAAAARLRYRIYFSFGHD